MKKRELSLHFPLGGVDRSIAYQHQQPYTTPKALNVWPAGTSELRTRGGTRPGLDVFVKDRVGTGGPIRLLNKVGVILDPSNSGMTLARSEQFRVPGPLGPWWYQPAFAPSTITVASQGGAKSTTSVSLGAAFNFADSTYTDAVPHHYAFRICPTLGTNEGIYKLYFGWDSGMVTGKELTITHNGDGTYDGNLEGTAFSGDDGAISGGWLSLKLTKSGSDYIATAFWKNTQLASVNVGTLLNFRWGMGVQWLNPVSGGCIGNIALQYPSTQKKEYNKEVLCAIADGDLYYETAPLELTKFTTTHNFAENRLIQSAEHLQKLYIADYEWMYSGTNGVADPSSFTNFHTADNVNFQTLGVTTDHVVHIQTITAYQDEIQTINFSGTISGGTWTITFDGETTGNLAHTATASEVKTALEALTTVDQVSVVRSGSIPYDYTVTFIGDHSGIDVSMMSVDATSLTGSGISVGIAETQKGADARSNTGVYTITEVKNADITLGSAVYGGGVLSSLGSLTFQILRNTKIFDPKALTLTNLTATAGKGIAPIGCKLVAKYLDRIVLAAPPDAPHLYFLSRQGDPLDWDYSQLDAGAAVSASVNETGAVGHPITALIPHSDQCLLFGCYSSLWIMRGDPASGGTVDKVSDKIGVVDASAWCHLPDDQLIILSADGLYIFPAGCHGTPQSLSRERIPDELTKLDPTQHSVTLQYDVEFRGVHVFLTREDKSYVYHWFFDWTTKSFWPMAFQTDHEPTASHFYTPLYAPSSVLLGGRDGYIRHFSREYFADDGGSQIENYVDMGPLKLNSDYHEGVVTELQCTLGRSSGNVTWAIRTGQSAEDAVYLEDSPHTTGTFGERLNYKARPRARGHSAVVRLTGAEKKPWIFESAMAVIRTAGKLRRRWS